MGIDHKRADLDIRSKFSFTTNQKKSFYDLLKKQAGLDGCVLISTCNRMELWLSSEGDASEDRIVSMLCDFLGVDTSEYESYAVFRQGKEAVEHLFLLASGLDSRIIGEDQIVTQVGDALAFARSCYTTDHTLEVLFRQAVTGAKRVKTETDLSTADKSVIHTALQYMKKEGFSVSGKTCMVIGNGMMGRISARTLLEQGADVMVTVRQYHSGVVEVPDGCRRIDYNDRLKMLPECDFVVSATSSPNYTLTRAELEPLNLDHRIFLIDLAVPRDIEPEAADLPWVQLYDIDSFHIDLESDKLKENLVIADSILREEEDRFYEWYEGKDYVPRIQRLKERAGADVVGRMTPALRQMTLAGSGKEELISEITGASSRMMNRLLFGLRTRVPDDVFRECLQAMEEIMEKEC